MSKEQPRTLPLAYRLGVELKFRGGGKSADVRKVCVPEEGGGEGIRLDFDPFTKAEPGLVTETARLVGSLPRGGIGEELLSDRREGGRETGEALEGGVGVADKARARGGGSAVWGRLAGGGGAARTGDSADDVVGLRTEAGRGGGGGGAGRPDGGGGGGFRGGTEGAAGWTGELNFWMGGTARVGSDGALVEGRGGGETDLGREGTAGGRRGTAGADGAAGGGTARDGGSRGGGFDGGVERTDELASVEDSVVSTLRFGTAGALPNDKGLFGVDPPAGFSFGMPPANSPPSCGGPPPTPTPTPAPALPPLPPPTGPRAPPAGLVCTAGALRSLVSVFLSFLPC